MSRKNSEEQFDAFIECIEKGLTEVDAAAAAGIGKTSVYEKKQREPEFSERVEKALAKFKMSNLEVIQKAAKKGLWTAAAWLLERKFPLEFGQKAALDLTSAGKPLQPPSWFGKSLDTAPATEDQKTIDITDQQDPPA